jgi:hypothetical protein
MKQTFFVAAALLAGFLGGIVGTRVARTREQPNFEPVVRARSFELVDEAGRAISYWGIDKSENAVLAFGSNRPMSRGGHPGLALDDPRNQRSAIGVIDDIPFLLFTAPDGAARMSLSLNLYEKPVLWMADETGKRVSLGLEQSDTPSTEDNNWALNFGPDRARIGMFTVEEGGQKYVKGFLSVSRDKVKYPNQQPK